MKLTVKTKYAASGEMNFYCPDGGGLIFMVYSNITNIPLCAGGHIYHADRPYLTAETEAGFKKLVRAWLDTYSRKHPAP